MNTFILKTSKPKNLIAIAVACALLTACASSPVKPAGSENLRSRLTQLQSDPRLVDMAPLAMKDAEAAVTLAERPEPNTALSAHLIFMADRKIDTAQAQAESKYAIAERNKLTDERDAMRLQSRTREADAANRRATMANVEATNQTRAAELARDQAVAARVDAEGQRNAADAARIDAEGQRSAANAARVDANAAKDATEAAQRNNAEMKKQLDEMQARETDRGLVLTLGDVLFSSGTSRLNRGGSTHLAKLATFLNKYADRNVTIEGYTDSVGSDEYNQELSQRRANAVKDYLTSNGVDGARVTASGKGEGSPVGDNSTPTGRQQNRRVEVIISNNSVAMR